MNLFEQIQQAINNCGLYEEYRVGIFVENSHKQEELSEILQRIIFVYSYADIRKTQRETLITFKNGSFIKIKDIQANCRGQRFNMIIEDASISYEISRTIIRPMIKCYPVNDTKRIEAIQYYADFSNIWKSLLEYRKEYINMAPYYTSTLTGTINTSLTSYTTPLATINKDNKRILLYRATGIDTFEYEKEFVNRTKETFLNIKGECDWYDGAYKNSVNIHLAINTDVYNGYEVAWESGILVVTLYEIVNKEPEFKEIGPF